MNQAFTALFSAAALFSTPGQAADNPLPDPLAAGWRGEAVCVRLHEDDSLRILRCTFPPGVGHEKHFHPRHFGYALSGGTMRVTDSKGVRDTELASGSYFSSDGIAWHEGLNVGESTVTYLMIEPKR
jgi:quercetin dioxygenase-like cupin family protein